MGDRRAERPHAEGDDIDSPAAHRAREQAVERSAHDLRVHPIVIRTGVDSVGKEQMKVRSLDTRDVGGIGTAKIGIRALGLVELDEGAALHHLGAEAVIFFLRTVAPIDPIGLTLRRDLVDPGEELRVACRTRRNSYGYSHPHLFFIAARLARAPLGRESKPVFQRAARVRRLYLESSLRLLMPPPNGRREVPILISPGAPDAVE